MQMGGTGRAGRKKEETEAETDRPPFAKTSSAKENWISERDLSQISMEISFAQRNCTNSNCCRRYAPRARKVIEYRYNLPTLFEISTRDYDKKK